MRRLPRAVWTGESRAFCRKFPRLPAGSLRILAYSRSSTTFISMKSAQRPERRERFLSNTTARPTISATDGSPTMTRWWRDLTTRVCRWPWYFWTEEAQRDLRIWYIRRQGGQSARAMPWMWRRAAAWSIWKVSLALLPRASTAASTGSR